MPRHSLTGQIPFLGIAKLKYWKQFLVFSKKIEFLKFRKKYIRMTMNVDRNRVFIPILFYILLNELFNKVFLESFGLVCSLRKRKCGSGFVGIRE